MQVEPAPTQIVLYSWWENLENHWWALCFNDSQDLCCLARLGVKGSIRQIGGPYESSKDAIDLGWRKTSSVICHFRYCLEGNVPKTFASSSRGYFSRKEDQEYEVMTRARMPVTSMQTEWPEAFALLTSSGETFVKRLTHSLLARDGHFPALLLSTLRGLKCGHSSLCVQGIFGSGKTYSSSLLVIIISSVLGLPTQITAEPNLPLGSFLKPLQCVDFVNWCNPWILDAGYFLEPPFLRTNVSSDEIHFPGLTAPVFFGIGVPGKVHPLAKGKSNGQSYTSVRIPCG